MTWVGSLATIEVPKSGNKSWDLESGTKTLGPRTRDQVRFFGGSGVCRGVNSGRGTCAAKDLALDARQTNGVRTVSHSQTKRPLSRAARSPGSRPVGSIPSHASHLFGCLAAYVSALPPLLPPGSFACSGSDGDGVPWSTPPPPRCFSFIFCRNPIGRYRRLLFRCLVCFAAKECAVSTVAFLHLGSRVCFVRFRVWAGSGFGFRVGNERRRRRRRRNKQTKKQGRRRILVSVSSSGDSREEQKRGAGLMAPCMLSSLGLETVMRKNMKQM